MIKAQTYLRLVSIAICVIQNTYSQNYLSGEIVSLNKKPIVNAHVNLRSISNDKAKTLYTITDKNGFYRIEIDKNTSYILQVTHLSYKTETQLFNFLIDKPYIRFLMRDKITELDEVVLESYSSTIIKNDTIIYETDAFVSGKERKLREVLKKLPGIEVDRDGNVSVLGKKITKVLVEDKTFFTGNSKLAVNNIPADVVDQVQVLDNYNEIGFLKGL